jgi:hypothetical protein
MIPNIRFGSSIEIVDETKRGMNPGTVARQLAKALADKGFHEAVARAIRHSVFL